MKMRPLRPGLNEKSNLKSQISKMKIKSQRPGLNEKSNLKPQISKMKMRPLRPGPSFVRPPQLKERVSFWNGANEVSEVIESLLPLLREILSVARFVCSFQDNSKAVIFNF